MNSLQKKKEEVLSHSLPLRDIEDLYPLYKQIKKSKFVLLGESSHGTHEYYTYRAQISKRLIEDQGFSFIAVEGDWPDCFRINRYIKGYSNAGKNAFEVLHAFNRWPTWMWANWEMVDFVEWLRKFNDNLPQERKIGFYGLDVYSLWESLDEVIDYLKKVDPKAVDRAVEAYICFEPYAFDPEEYGRATAFVPTSCEDEVVGMLKDLLARRSSLEETGKESYFNAQQNAYVAQNAERYYRSILRGDTTSWNIRDTHMAQTLENITTFYGSRAKGIVWAHNTHIGDARFTDMSRIGMISLGQLTRQTYGDDKVTLFGFSSFQGSVIASSVWGAPMQKMTVPKAKEGSWDEIFHTTFGKNRLFLFKCARKLKETSDLMKYPSLRAIGVVYDPDYELENYAPTDLSKRFDAFVYLEETKALTPLHMKQQADTDFPETFPMGV